MKEIKGQLLDIHPLDELRHEMDLIYFEGPFLSLFRNESEEPYLYYWVDSNAESNRWIVFRTNPDRLASYFNARTTLRDLFLNAGDGSVLIADMDNDSQVRVVVQARVGDIPEDYQPDTASYYQSEPVNVKLDLGSLSDLYNSDLLNLHLLRGPGVEFGSASITTVGPILSATGELSELVAEKKFARFNKPRITKKEARLYGTFHWVTDKAASFSMILRPQIRQIAIPGFEEKHAEVVEALLKLVTSATDYEAIRGMAEELGPDVVKSLSHLMQAIRDREIDLRMNWVNHETKEVRTARAGQHEAEIAIKNIEKMELEGAQEFEWIGHFKALNVDSRSYTFQNREGARSTGHVGETGASLRSVSFEREYQIRIRRRVLVSPRRARKRVEDVITELSATGLFEQTDEDKGEGEADKTGQE